MSTYFNFQQCIDSGFESPTRMLYVLAVMKTE
jgi:hypothetical protein